MENNSFIIKLQAMLDKAKSLLNIKSDIKSIESKLKIKIQGTLDKTATKKELNSSLKSIKPKIKVDADTSQAMKKIKKLGQKKTKTTIQPIVDNSQVTSGLKATQKETKSLFDRFLNGAVGVNLVRMSVQKVTQAVYEAIAGLKELDKIKTNIQMVSGASDSGVDAMMQSYNSMAKQLRSTTKSVSEAANEFLRMGESVSSTNELIKSSQVLSKVGMIESSDAASYLISSLKGYQIAADDSIKVIDKLTSVDLEAAVSAGGLAEALSRCANIANNSGTSMDRLIGYMATAGEVTQESMSVIGNAFKSMYSRMNNIKIGKFVDDETGESLSDTEKVLKKLGIQLRDTEDTYRDFDDVLDDIGGRWKSFTQVEQNAISVAIAGTMQRERFNALMNNYSNALKYSETAANSAGSALERYGVYEDSIEAKTNQLTAAIESLSINTLSEGLLSGIVEATTGLVEFIDKFGILKGTLAGFVTMGISKMFVSMATGIVSAAKSTAQLTSAMAMFDQGKSIANLKRIGQACKGLSDQQLKLILSTKNLTYAQRLSILEGMGVAEAEREQTLATLGFASAENTATVSTFSLKGAMDSLKVAFLSNPIGAIITGLTVAVTGFTMVSSYFKQKNEELIQSTKDASQAYLESAGSIKDYATRYKELQEALTAAKGNEQETYNIKKQLLDLQTELNEKYGEEYGYLNLVTDSYKDQTDAIQNLNKEAAQTFLNENMKGILKAEEQMQKELHYVLDYSEHLGTEKGDAIKEIAEKYKDRGIYLHDETGDGSYAQFSVNIKADAQSAYETINDFQNELREKAKELGNEDLFSGIINISSSAINDAKKVIDNYGDIFNQALTAEIASDDDKAVKYNEALEAVNAFNEAVLQSEDVYNDKNVDNARQSLQEIKEELESSEEWEKYSSLIDDVFEQADTKLLDFNNHIKNDDSIRKLAEDLEGLDDLDLKAFDENIGENTSFDKLKESAESYGLSVEELIDTLVRLGYVQGEISNQEQQSPYALSIDEAKKAVNGTDNVIGLIEEYELLQEIMSDTGNIQQETYSKLISCSSKYSTAIKTENGHITVNTTKLKAVAKSRQMDTKEAIKQTLALKKQEWVQWNNNIENYNGTLLENIQNTYGDIDALQQQITQFELLSNSIDDAADSFLNFQTAQSTNDQENYDTAKEMFDVLKGYSSDPENENYGKYNRDEFQEAAMGMMDNKTYKKFLNAKDLGEAQEVVDGFVKSIEPLFDEKNYNSAKNLFDRINEIMESGDIPEADIDWAKRLGISEEAFHALSTFANQYDFNNKEIFESYQLNTLDEYQSLLSNVRISQEALNECTDKTGNEFDYLSMQLEEANRRYIEFKNETAEKVENAYADFIHSDEKSKGSFSDYLKQSMGVEDSDITGMISVLLDKSKSLQENLANMHPDSAAYELHKKQLEDINALLGSLDFDIDSIDQTRSLEDKIAQYKELAAQAEECRKTLETEDEGSDAYKEAAQELEHISALMDELRDPLRLEINSNISEIDSQIAQLDEKLNGLKESLKHASGSNDAYAIHMEMIGANNEKAKLEEQKAELQETVKLIVDSAEVDEYQPEEKEGTVKYSPDFAEVTNTTPPVLKGTVEYEAKMPGQPTTPASPSSKQAEADGTFNAFANGTSSDVSIKKDEKALVNELGEEGLVRNGKLIPIKGGAQFVNLKRGDIVFNHKQMEQLKKNGYTSGRGRLVGAHAEGTIHAYDTGTRINIPHLKDVSENNRAIQHAKNASKEAADAVKESAEEEKEAFEEIFDWIERRIKNFQRKFDKWLNQAETAVTSGFITKYYKKAAKSLNKELNTYGKAYKRYMKEANSAGLSRKYRKKVKNGTIDIESITDEKLAEKIKTYQDYYDKAVDSTTSFVETAEELYSLPLDKAAAKIEKFSDAIDLLDKKLDNATGAKAKNSLIDQQTAQEKNTLDAYAAASTETKKKLDKAGANLLKSNTLKNSGVTSKEKKTIQNAVKNGTEINLAYFKEGSKGYNAAVKYNEALKANAQAVYDLQTAQEDYTSWLVEAAKLKFDNIADDYEKKIQMIDYQMTDLDNKISEIETRGKKVNKAYYESQKSINIQTIDQLKKERAELEQSLKSIKQGTDEWYDAYDKLKQIDSDISSKIKDNYENVNKINQLYFDMFSDTSDFIGRIITEQDFLRGLFAHEKTVDTETGSFTDAGLAKLGSLSAGYYAANDNAERDKSVLKELLETREKGLQSDGSYKFGNWEFNSFEDLQAQIDEFYTKEQNAIKERYSLETEIYDLMKERYQAELDYLKELIDDKKDALNAEKDLHDYQKTIQEKTNDISTLRKQISAYSGDTSEEGMAKLQKLQKELADKEEDLKETEYDRYISDQQDMLDKLYEEYEELMTKKLDDFMTLVKEGLDTSNDNMAVIADFLNKTADDNDYITEIKDLFNGILGNIKDNVTDIIGNAAKDITDRSGTVPETSSNTSTNSENTQSSIMPSARPSIAGVSTTPDSSAGNTIELNNASYRDIAAKYIKNHANKAKNAKDKYDAVNKKIYENKSGSYSGTGKVLSENELKTLAGKLGVTYDNNKKSGNLYKKLQSIKFPGFKKGGIVSVDDIEKQVHENGDTSLVSVQNGEGILTPEQVEPIQKLVDSVPDINRFVEEEQDKVGNDGSIKVGDTILTPVKSELFDKFTAYMSGRTDNPFNANNLITVPNYMETLKNVDNSRHMNNDINIDMGGINMYGVNDPKEFADQLAQSVQTVPKARNVIRSVSIDMMDGGGRCKLGIDRIR